jgi:hypothetical protein
MMTGMAYAAAQVGERFREMQAPLQEHEQARQVQQERQERERTERAERHGRVRAARTRAETTLRTFIGEERWTRWQRDEILEVRGSETGQLYLISPGVVNNVHLVDEEYVEQQTLCAHPPLSQFDENGRYLGELPLADVYLHQLLLIQTDEPGFRRVANISNQHRGRRWPVARSSVAA